MVNVLVCALVLVLALALALVSADALDLVWSSGLVGVDMWAITNSVNWECKRAHIFEGSVRKSVRNDNDDRDYRKLIHHGSPDARQTCQRWEHVETEAETRHQNTQAQTQLTRSLQ